MNATEIAQTSITAGASQKLGELAPLVELVANLEPAVILEIGSMNGGTLIAWRAAAQQAELISLSLTDGPHGGGRVPDSLPDRHIDADSHDPHTLGEIKDILSGRAIDFLFIDADHSYAGVKSDWLMYSPLVRKGGIVAFHDILFHAPSANVDVKTLWDELKVDHETVEFCIPDQLRPPEGQWGGIGVIYL